MKESQAASANANHQSANSPLAAQPVPAADADAKPRGRIIWLVLLVIVFAIAAGIYLRYFSDTRPVVLVERLAPAPADRVLIVSGRTRSELEADLMPAVSGTLSKVLAREGTEVETGQNLIELDAERARLSVREAEAALDSARVSQQRAQEDFNRAQALETTVSLVERTRAAEALSAAKLEVKRLAAALERARIALADYRIAAPFSGTILERLVVPGEHVQSGSIVMRIADLKQLYTEIEVDEDYSASIEVGQKALIQLAGRDTTLSGQVSLVEPEVNTVTGAIPVRIAFDRPPLAPTGLTAVVNIVTASGDSVLTIPRTALVESTSAAVFVVRDSKAVRTPIKIVDWPADRVEVMDGLQEGDLVVLNPEKISNGMAVKLPPAIATNGS